MRTFYVLLIALMLVTLTGCLRVHESGDEVVIGFRWWTLLWPFVVAPCFTLLAFTRHPSVWVNGKWRRWWTFQGWESKEFGYAAAGLLAIPMGMYYMFDRVVVTPEYFEQSNTAGFGTTRKVFYRDIVQVQVDPPEKVDNPNIPSYLRRRRAKASPEFVATLKNGGREEFSGRLIKAVKEKVVSRARTAGVAILEPQPANSAADAIRSNNAAQPPAVAPKSEPTSTEPFKFVPPTAPGSSKANDARERAKEQIQKMKSGKF